MRNHSIDLLRGFAVFLMVLVNFPGSWSSIFAPFLHAKDTGFTIADLVFPIFLWTVGYSIQISLHKHQGDTNWKFISHVLFRFFILFSCGLFLSLFPNGNWDTFRIPGVLQRIAFCYLILILMFRFLTFRSACTIAILLSGISLLANRFIQFQQSEITFSSLVPATENTLGAMLDRLIFKDHLWKESRVYDPEGILTSVGALPSVLWGIFQYRLDERKEKPAYEVSLCISLILAGLIISPIFPISKTNWTLSYILLSSGIVNALYLIFRWVSEKHSLIFLNNAFQVLYGEIGKQALLIFFLSGLLARTKFFSEIRNQIFLDTFQLSKNKEFASLMFSIFFYIFLIILFQIQKQIRSRSF